ncbi:Prephenate and/or arogenate dehydrogenase [Bathymodiolus heckerae thiotrophic gill symbiont]|uniref:prephenate dehydrogenase n=1 Tax=Bathymodiolus heckerae thiotrophic gill symbiont TaxID=1052212 RepID=UPI0010B6C19B|nr:Prephenate and/or arogenate dehydrogenase (unknown specificity) (EC 1.3.1.12)(EC 1.3.1.43) [uncultured Gammaproteobacteria bacterium]SHN89998.1 Prephenate and/or arogenate dehydrogenase [Bathymodiolus heckerae thiotrophic gill symbiont]
MMNKICIIGVGLIGGSFAAGLKKSNQVETIVGFGRNESNLIKAQALNVIDEYSLDIAQALVGASLILIATPVNSFKSVLEMIKPHVTEKMIVTDVGSTKTSVVDMARQVFETVPENFIPAHPIAGKEQSGVEAADANLFNNKRVIITPEVNANTQSVATVSELWEAIGAKVEIMNTSKHDDLLAMTSHLPHMLAFGLMDYLISNDPDACDYAAGGFKDFSRIASSDAVMWRDICINNPEQIVKHIEGYQKSLDNIANLIKNNQPEALEKLFSDAKSARDGWLKD